MLPDNLQTIFNRLMGKHEREIVIARTKAESALEAIKREDEAYILGMIDALKAVAALVSDMTLDGGAEC